MKKNAIISLLAAIAFMLGVNIASANDMTDRDMQMAFGGSLQPHNAVMLSQQEMVATEGEWLLNSAGALLGGLGAGFGAYWGGMSISDSFATGLAGAAAGAWSPVRGFTSAWQTFGGGFTGGYVSSWF